MIFTTTHVLINHAISHQQHAVSRFYLCQFSSELSNSQELMSMFTSLRQHYVNSRHFLNVFIFGEVYH